MLIGNESETNRSWHCHWNRTVRMVRIAWIARIVWNSNFESNGSNYEAKSITQMENPSLTCLNNFRIFVFHKAQRVVHRHTVSSPRSPKASLSTSIYIVDSKRLSREPVGLSIMEIALAKQKKVLIWSYRNVPYGPTCKFHGSSKLLEVRQTN